MAYRVVVSTSLGPKDYFLTPRYYDFSVTDPDFSGTSKATFNNPGYVAR